VLLDPDTAPASDPDPAPAPAPEAAPTPRWQRRPEARPDEILEAAFRVFGEHGFARAKLEDVAQAAGVSKGTLYLYFDSKETLFREMVRAKVVPLVEQGEAKLQAHEGPYRELLVSLVTTMYDTMLHRGLGRISRLVISELGAFPELARFYYEEVVLRAQRLLEQLLERGVAAGEFRPVPHHYAARGIPALVLHALQTQCTFQQFDPRAPTESQVLEGIVDLYLHGVLARAESDR
jgi:AcrR family transcriptional regulator